eukprot:TRINITY_DN21450_c0_g1::TRINITY_DN21450_c0_g1_i1::g.10071::m.10071 TRINITY_DN21450_c0_g1::TRINITY_DN21450_c0_g1_i1::g.10071  ORF type:complete len:119 (-),score=2.16,sp/Q8WW35/TC1D2_HUMAN/56.03/1e-43,Tctex-1/PF03645.8/8.6e-28 TRINITY_DN21450_c0_g1_i1:507-863(-)
MSNDYEIRPDFRHKFRPRAVKGIIHDVLTEKLSGVIYHAENTSQATRDIADEIKIRLKELNMERYKLVVQVVIGEQRGEGVRMGGRCFWDEETDNYAQDIYMNESLFCVAAAFGIYLY